MNQENQDELVHRKQLSKVIADTHAKEFIGKWQLMGEIIEPSCLFNPKKTHTKTGSKYHRAGCRYLRKSQIDISLSEAKNEGYTACSVCF